MKGNSISRITIVILSFASFMSSSKQRKSILLSAVSWGDVSEISNNGWQGEECTCRSDLALRLQFTYSSLTFVTGIRVLLTGVQRASVIKALSDIYRALFGTNLSAQCSSPTSLMKNTLILETSCTKFAARLNLKRWCGLKLRIRLMHLLQVIQTPTS